MVTDQLSIFEVSASTTQTATHRCRMCARPARWLITQQHYAMYCAGGSCGNRERICQTCGSSFVMNVDGAGTKYCSTECKANGYRPHKIGTTLCAWCKKESEKVRARSGGAWPYICNSCLTPIRHVVHRLKAHHVSHDRARRLLDDPGCEVCGADMLVKTREQSTGKIRASLVVDHDHGCCPVSQHSCGRCIRGLLCSHCNIAAGMLKDNPMHARSLGDYLESWFSR